jgi:uncharacterized protein involved in exopolysaccharide biosynthesis
MRGLERTTVLLGEKSDALRDAQRRLAEASKLHIEADSDAGRLAHRESEVGQALFTARSQYTGDHPEVQRLERELATVRQKRLDAEAAIRNADTTRATAAAQVNELQRELTTVQQQADMYKQRIDNTPRWSTPLAELDQQYEILKQKYQQMLSRKVEADVAHDLEMRARANMFHVLSEAAEPAVPARPDKAAGFMLVALVALALGVLAGVILELQDDSLREPADALHQLRIPVLAVVPRLDGATVGSKTLRPVVNRPTLDA